MDRASEKTKVMVNFWLKVLIGSGVFCKCSDSYLFYHEVGDENALGAIRQPLAGQPGLHGRKLVQDLVPDRADQHVAATVDMHVFQLRALDQQPF